MSWKPDKERQNSLVIYRRDARDVFYNLRIATLFTRIYVSDPPDNLAEVLGQLLDHHFALPYHDGVLVFDHDKDVHMQHESAVYKILGPRGANMLVDSGLGIRGAARPREVGFLVEPISGLWLEVEEGDPTHGGIRLTEVARPMYVPTFDGGFLSMLNTLTDLRLTTTF